MIKFNSDVWPQKTSRREESVVFTEIPESVLLYWSNSCFLANNAVYHPFPVWITVHIFTVSAKGCLQKWCTQFFSLCLCLFLCTVSVYFALGLSKGVWLDSLKSHQLKCPKVSDIAFTLGDHPLHLLPDISIYSVWITSLLQRQPNATILSHFRFFIFALSTFWYCIVITCWLQAIVCFVCEVEESVYALKMLFQCELKSQVAKFQLRKP